MSLEYSVRAAQVRKFRWWRGIWFVDAVVVPRQPQLRGWWGRRLLYYAAMLALCLTIAFYVGPNEILFRRVIYPYDSLSDYVPEITSDCVPLVRAVKQYQRENGKLPDDLSETMPADLASCPLPARILGEELYFLKGDHLICYSFTPAIEGWTVSEGRVNGSVPAPLVVLGPATRPTSARAMRTACIAKGVTPI